MPDVCTVGYEGCDINQFAEKLIINGIKSLIDVREKPLSRKNGFAKFVLKHYLKFYGIEYFHIGELGSPSRIRYKLYSTGDYNAFFSAYSKYLATQRDALDKLMKILKNNPKCCIMCFEKDYNTCHRKIIAEHLSALDFGIKHI